MYTARYLGAEGFGILSFALAFTGLFATFTNLGLSTLTIREVARDKSLVSKYLGNIGLMKIVSVIVMFMLIAVIINLLAYPQQTIVVVYIIALSVILDAYSIMFYSVFQAHERMEYVSVGRIIGSTLRLTGIFIAVRYSFSIIGFASLYLVASASVLVYTFFVCKSKFTMLKLQLDWEFWKRTIKQALPFGLSGFFVVIYLRIDTVMLSLIKGDVVVGWYNAANRLVFLLLFIPAAFFSSLFPVIAQFHKTAEKSLKTTFDSSFRYMVIIALPMGIGITLLANEIIPLIYGVEYSPSIPALQVLIWSMVFSYMSHAPMYLLYSVNKQVIYTKIVFICMVLNVLSNLLLIPKLSYIGAGIATVLTQGLAFVIIFAYVTRFQFGSPISYKNIVKLGLSNLGICLFIVGCRGIVNLGLIILLSVVVYLFFLWIFKIFSREDMHILRCLLKSSTRSIVIK